MLCFGGKCQRSLCLPLTLHWWPAYVIVYVWITSSVVTLMFVTWFMKNTQALDFKLHDSRGWGSLNFTGAKSAPLKMPNNNCFEITFFFSSPNLHIIVKRATILWETGTAFSASWHPHTQLCSISPWRSFPLPAKQRISTPRYRDNTQRHFSASWQFLWAVQRLRHPLLLTFIWHSEGYLWSTSFHVSHLGAAQARHVPCPLAPQQDFSVVVDFPPAHCLESVCGRGVRRSRIDSPELGETVNCDSTDCLVIKIGRSRRHRNRKNIKFPDFPLGKNTKIETNKENIIIVMSLNIS